MITNNRGGSNMSDQEQETLEVEEVVEPPKFRHMQVKLTQAEYKEVNVWLIQNDITDKGDFLKQILLRKVRNYEPVQTNERLHASQNIDGFDALR